MRTSASVKNVKIVANLSLQAKRTIHLTWLEAQNPGGWANKPFKH